MLMLAVDCSDPNLAKILGLIRNIVELIQILVPIALILMGSIDFGKAVISSNEENIKKEQKKFISRCLAAVLVFLVVAIVNFVMNFVGEDSWQGCWSASSIDVHERITDIAYL
ncbi:MAG: hypothetical protein PHW32_04930 [Bacilli bacterium]|nr:hypothetical protein [Bacilli bacterium]MDD3305444.1 hypothetical protein [Bacilli bacterium]MDD4283212.1 hypothetical protein [Bacilli bacterium]